MKNTQLKVLFLHLLKLTNNKQNEKGFTLIELLVVVIIIGILSAITLPSMLNQARRAREASALNDIGAVNRSQQAYRLENSLFANSINGLSVNIPTSRNGYTYSFGRISSELAEFRAAPIRSDQKAFTGCTTAASGVSNTTTTSRIEESAVGGAAPIC